MFAPLNSMGRIQFVRLRPGKRAAYFGRRAIKSSDTIDFLIIVPGFGRPIRLY